VLCRDVYHCLPSELEQEDWATVQEHVAMLDGEASGKAARNA